MLTLKPYRSALALPGIRPLLLVAMLARVPATMMSVTLTLYVVLVLDHGYAAAGLAGAAHTVGSAFGAPLLGRLVDRRGLRLMLVVTTASTAVFWVVAPAMPYPVLLAGSLLGGLLNLPVFSVIRQSVAALVPPEQRRPAYALDSMSVELSFMVGPALAVLLATTVSPRAAMLTIGAGILIAGVTLLVLNPPTRADHEPATASRPIRRREWLTPRLLGILAISIATTVVLGGTDVAVVAVLREADQLAWTGAVLVAWGSYSLIGGFTYGAVPRPLSPAMLVILLGLCTIPVGLGGDHWWLLGITLLPAGALCAPALAATADAVSRLTPASVRGEAMGLHGSAVTVGIALGAPLAGAVIDASSPAWGFAATGALGAVVALAVLPTEKRRIQGGARPIGGASTRDSGASTRDSARLPCGTSTTRDGNVPL